MTGDVDERKRASPPLACRKGERGRISDLCFGRHKRQTSSAQLSFSPLPQFGLDVASI